jgi:PAS domain S-box-containing protein
MNKARILIIEDEAIIAMEIESQLQSLGYEVTSIVDTGERAIQKAEADKPDIILMDIRIKGEIDGIDTAEIIRLRFGIPVIFSTAYLDQERIERAKITMPFGYVLKPIQERDLRVTIEMALYVAKVDAKRRQVENELRLEKEKYKIAYYTSPDAVNINRMDGRYVEINEGFTRLTGFTRDDAIGKPSSEIKIWAIPEDRGKLIEGLKSNGYVENLESKFRCKNGSFRTALMSATIINIDEEPHILSVTRDISERKEIEKELQANQLIFSQLFYQSSTSMCLYNRDGTIEKANQEFCEMFGVIHSQCPGTALFAQCRTR